MKRIVKKQSLSKTLLCGIAICAASFAAMNLHAQPGTYNPGDIAVINNIIASNGLSWTKAEPADGSFVPADWTGCQWTSDATNKRITKLYVDEKSLIGMLDVSGLENLEYLDCMDNQLTAINVSGLENLQYFGCHFNQLTALDVSGLESLIELYCGYNKLTLLDVSGLEKLKELRCSDNHLTELDLTGLDLSWFSASNQSISLTMKRNGANYTAAITLNAPANLAAGITYNSGILTSTNNAIANSPFSVQTGSAGKTLSGTLNFTYVE